MWTENLVYFTLFSFISVSKWANIKFAINFMKSFQQKNRTILSQNHASILSDRSLKPTKNPNNIDSICKHLSDLHNCEKYLKINILNKLLGLFVIFFFLYSLHSFISFIIYLVENDGNHNKTKLMVKVFLFDTQHILILQNIKFRFNLDCDWILLLLFGITSASAWSGVSMGNKTTIYIQKRES